jgi:hypothetical protein
MSKKVAGNPSGPKKGPKQVRRRKEKSETVYGRVIRQNAMENCGMCMKSHITRKENFALGNRWMAQDLARHKVDVIIVQSCTGEHGAVRMESGGDDGGGAVVV